jgi:hypothetical protein
MLRQRRGQVVDAYQKTGPYPKLSIADRLVYLVRVCAAFLANDGHRIARKPSSDIGAPDSDFVTLEVLQELRKRAGRERSIAIGRLIKPAMKLIKSALRSREARSYRSA